jgi:OmpA-OmpF porin, OOP family
MERSARVPGVAEELFMRSLHRKIGSPLVVLALSLLASSARAQGANEPATGFALNRYNPAERGSEWFVSDSLDLRGSFRPAFGLTLDLAYKPLAIYSAEGEERTALVSSQLYAHLGGSMVFLDRFRVGLSVPIAFVQSGTSGSAEGFTVTAPSGASFSDLRLGADVRLFGVYGEPFTLALGAQIFLPTGRPTQYTGDGSVGLLPRVSAAGDYRMFTYAGSLGIHYRGAPDGFAGQATGTEFLGSLSAGLRLLDGTLVVGPELFGSAVFGTNAPVAKPNPVELLAGAHYSLGNLRLGFGIGPGLTRGIGTPALRMLASAEWVVPANQDQDGDGIIDRLDACVTVPGVADEDPKKNGCPPDRDNDGIYDVSDACIDVPGVASDDPKKNGCPPDRDNDGIYDASDACPDEPGERNEDPKKNGCPPDRDGDGIPDAKDACPDVPGERNEDPLKNGCPADRDGDGVYDTVDKCIDIPGLKVPPASVSAAQKPEWEKKFLGCPEDIDKDGIPNMPDACPLNPGPPHRDSKKNGCPAVRIDGCEIKIQNRIYFKTQSDKLENFGDKAKETQAILKAVLDLVQATPAVKKIEIQGHASQDNYAKNQELSEQRAATVVRWLVEHGVDATRLTPKGYGSTRPAKGASLEKAYKELHQRVEFHILEPVCKDEPIK